MKSKTINIKNVGKITMTRKLNVRNLSIYIRKNSIKVSFPWWISFPQAEKFVLSKSGFIQKKLKTLPVSLELKTEDIEQIRQEAKKYLPQKTAELAEKYGFEYKKVTIRNSKTRWGSCSSLGNINLSLHLMKLPIKLRDYVILHELCHTKQPNHSPKFWKLLESVFPNVKDCRKELRKFHINIC